MVCWFGHEQKGVEVALIGWFDYFYVEILEKKIDRPMLTWWSCAKTFAQNGVETFYSNHPELMEILGCLQPNSNNCDKNNE